LGIQSCCLLPLSTAQRKIGGLYFGSRRPHAYSSEDIEFMRDVALQVSVAVDNALNYEAAAVYEQELTRERDHLRLLLEVNNATVTHLETRELFRAISGCLRQTLGVDFASLVLFDETSNELRRRLLDFPEGHGLLREDVVLPVDSAAGRAFTTGQPVLFGREDIEQMPDDLARFLLAEGLQSLCAAPLTSRQRTLGTLNLASRREHAFNEEDVRLMVEVAGQVAIALDNALAYQRIEELNAKLAEGILYLEDEVRTEGRLEDVIGNSAAWQAVLRQVETVGPSDSTVLIFGETGTGKEVIARAIHEVSLRQKTTFVKLNCASIPSGLLESEMFGHEKGAFTGAITQRIGRFELADKGTLFLDEVGDIPLELQPKMLRVLQEREFERLGSTRTLRVDVRLVAATNRDLFQMVEDREFRADLFYRLNVFPIVIPPLRERLDDIPPLVRHFAQQFAKRMRKRIDTIPSEVMEALVGYSWPGNVRELQNLIERAVILTQGSVLKIPLRELAPRSTSRTLKESEREHILRALRDSNWIVAGPHGAAARLGLKRSTLQFRMRKLGIARKA
jgi:formate hydrogenlyase transcriptional activator